MVAASVLFLLTYLPAQTTGSEAAKTAAKSHSQKKHAAAKPAPEPETPPQPPPPPPTPEQMPAVPPQVSYNDGLLSIVAANSTLSDILHLVSVRTGANVDAPPYLTGERVAVHIGPGTPRDVLSDLLSGSHFDYILLGSDGDPNAVRSIILTPNQKSPAATAVAQVQPARPVQTEQEDTDDDADDQPAQPAPPQPLPPRRRPFAPEQPPDQVTRPSGEGAQQQPQAKSPEQLLEDLRRMQQQGSVPPQSPDRNDER